MILSNVTGVTGLAEIHRKITEEIDAVMEGGVNA